MQPDTHPEFLFFKKSAPCFVTVCAAVIFIIAPVLAHNVTIFAWVEGDTVYTESKFSGGRKAQNAPIEVYDAQGDKQLEGKTDENGEFSFKIPKKTALTIVLLAGMGHRSEWTIPLDEVAPGLPDQTAAKMRMKVGKKTNQREAQPVSLPPVSASDIESAVEKALDQKLKPLVKLLTESRKQGPSVSDIFGGIGYIFGLMGVGAYFHYRKKKDESLR